MRGFGGPQVYFALERLMDRIAVQLGLDPFELRAPQLRRQGPVPVSRRRRRAARFGRLRARDGHGDQPPRASTAWRRAAPRRGRGKLYGIGCAAIVEPSISNMGYISPSLTAEQRARAGPKNGGIASATVAIDLLGGVNVTIESTPAGQGHITVCGQVVADVFGLAPEQIVSPCRLRHRQGRLVGRRGQLFEPLRRRGGRRGAPRGQPAARQAGAHRGGAIRLRRRMRCASPAARCSMRHAPTPASPSRASPPTRTGRRRCCPPASRPGLRESVAWTPDVLDAPSPNDRVNTSAAYGFVFDVCGLEVDPDTGRARVDRYITVHDAGRLLNPALADGQVRGGFAQGVGAALLEEFRYGADGSFQSGTLADYLIPTCCEVPDPVILHLETPSPFTPLGAKGLAEGNNMSTPVTIANAFADALRRLPGRSGDVDDLRLPLTPARVLAHLAIPETPPRGAQHEAARATPAAARGAADLQAAGHVDIAASPERVFEVLLDPAALARVIPGCHALEAIGPQRYRADVTVGIGLVKARYAATIELSEIDRPRSLRLAGSGQSALGTAAGSGTVRLEPTPGGTRLHYDYRAQVGGKVAAVGSRMLEGAARILLAQLFAALGSQAGGAAVAPPGSRAGRGAVAPLSWWRRLLRRLGIGAP